MKKTLIAAALVCGLAFTDSAFGKTANADSPQKDAVPASVETKALAGTYTSRVGSQTSQRRTKPRSSSSKRRTNSRSSSSVPTRELDNSSRNLKRIDMATPYLKRTDKSSPLKSSSTSDRRQRKRNR